MTDTDRELVARLEELTDDPRIDNPFRGTTGQAADRIEALTSDRDAWKARAEAAERERDDLRGKTVALEDAVGRAKHLIREMDRDLLQWRNSFSARHDSQGEMEQGIDLEERIRARIDGTGQPPPHKPGDGQW